MSDVDDSGLADSGVFVAALLIGAFSGASAV